MAYQTLLAYVPSEDVGSDVVSVAASLAQLHRAHLIGLHVIPPIAAYMAADVYLPSDVTDQYVEQQRQQSRELQAMFESRCQNQEFVSEWRVDETSLEASRVVSELGNTADLVILSQSDGRSKAASRHEYPGSVLTTCGRSVLVVPKGYDREFNPRRVLLAWDGKRESTRAMFAALPMLRNAEIVRLQRINPPDQDRHHMSGLSEELARALARHGVNIEVFESDADSREIGEELLAYAADIDADVLVMGAYGHGLVHDFLLGGTTRHVLKHMKIPVLMSN